MAVGNLAEGRIAFRSAGTIVGEESGDAYPHRCYVEEYALRGPKQGKKCMMFNQTYRGYERWPDVRPEMGGAMWNYHLDFEKRDLQERPGAKCSKKARPVLYGYEERDGVEVTWALRFQDDNDWAKFQDTRRLDNVGIPFRAALI